MEERSTLQNEASKVNFFASSGEGAAKTLQTKKNQELKAASLSACLALARFYYHLWRILENGCGPVHIDTQLAQWKQGGSSCQKFNNCKFNRCFIWFQVSGPTRSTAHQKYITNTNQCDIKFVRLSIQRLLSVIERTNSDPNYNRALLKCFMSTHIPSITFGNQILSAACDKTLTRWGPLPYFPHAVLHASHIIYVVCVSSCLKWNQIMQPEATTRTKPIFSTSPKRALRNSPHAARCPPHRVIEILGDEIRASTMPHCCLCHQPVLQRCFSNNEGSNQMPDRWFGWKNKSVHAISTVVKQNLCMLTEIPNGKLHGHKNHCKKKMLGGQKHEAYSLHKRIQQTFMFARRISVNKHQWI